MRISQTAEMGLVILAVFTVWFVSIMVIYNTFFKQKSIKRMVSRARTQMRRRGLERNERYQ